MKSIFLLFCLFALASTAHTQSNTASIDTDLYQHLKNIRQWREDDRYNNLEGSYDSVVIENERLIKKMLDAFNKYPATLSAPFDSLDTGMNIASSPDKKFRVYSWNTETGGTMRFFANIIQFKTPTGVKAVLYSNPIENPEETGCGFFYDTVYQLAKGKETYYLATRTAIFSSKDLMHGLKIFKITNGHLNDTAPLIKTKTGIRNEIGYEYDLFSVVDIPYGHRPQIKFHNKTNILSIPLVTEDGKVTNKTIRYKFDGQYFVKM
jgi:hypothetical protein